MALKASVNFNTPLNDNVNDDNDDDDDDARGIENCLN